MCEWLHHKVFSHIANGFTLNSATYDLLALSIYNSTDPIHNPTIAEFMESSATSYIATFSSSVLVSGWKLWAKVYDGLNPHSNFISTHAQQPHLLKESRIRDRNRFRGIDLRISSHHPCDR